MSEAGKPLVLVVEDEEIVREIVCIELAEAGFDVLEARNGDEALKLLSASGEAHHVSMLFTDIRMPGTLDGWALAEKARALIPSLQVVYASGHLTAPDRAVPGSVFLRKPYRTKILIESLQRLLPR